MFSSLLCFCIFFGLSLHPMNFWRHFFSPITWRHSTNLDSGCLWSHGYYHAALWVQTFSKAEWMLRLMGTRPYLTMWSILTVMPTTVHVHVYEWGETLNEWDLLPMSETYYWVLKLSLPLDRKQIQTVMNITVKVTLIFLNESYCREISGNIASQLLVLRT